MNPKRVYLAGPMTGLPQYNFPAFDAAALSLRSLGYTVYSPVELDRALNGAPELVSWPEALARDVKLLGQAHIRRAFVLPGWEKSKGARLETFVIAALHNGEVYSMRSMKKIPKARLAIAWVFGR